MKLSLTFAVSLAVCGVGIAAEADWKAVYEAGVKADDYADYKKAEALFEQACAAAQAEPDAGPEATACIRLVEFQATDGKLKRADRTAQLLVESLETRGEPAPLILALLESADVLSARTRPKIAVLRLKRVADLLSRVGQMERIEALQRMSLYYAAIGHDKDALHLANRAQAEVVPLLDFQTAAPLQALVSHARLLNILERHKDALEVLDPVVRGVDHRMPQFDDLDPELQQAYVDVIRKAIDALTYAGAGDAVLAPYSKRKEVLLQRIKPLGNELFRPSDDGMEPPRIKNKVDPVYPDGARASRAGGSVELLVEIWPDGKPHRIRPAHRAPYGLTSAAVTALRKWRFYPGTHNGAPVRVLSTIQFNFHMQ